MWLLFLGGWLGLSSEALAAPLEGRVYDARSAELLAGVELRLFYDEVDSLEPGQEVPAERLGPGEQGQRSGPDGSYSFDLPEGRIYRLEVRPTGKRLAFPSQLRPPTEAFATTGDISPNDIPQPRGEPGFYLRFDTQVSRQRFNNNHIALDRFADAIDLRLRADRSTLGVGDVLRFEATLDNQSSADLQIRNAREVFLHFAPARGLNVNLSSAVAVIADDAGRTRAVTFRSERVSEKSDRLVQFGPFELATGETLSLHYQATVGLDTRPGRYLSRMRAEGRGGEAFAAEAQVTTAIREDRDFSRSVVIGRVFCDADGDHELDPGETGVFGAQVFLDSGVFAITDRHGRFHLTRIRPGSHVLKLDEGSLAGGKIRGRSQRFLNLSEGLPTRVSYPVRCGRTWVAPAEKDIHLLSGQEPEEDEAAPHDPSASVRIRGRLEPMTISVDDRRVDIPSVSLKEDFGSLLTIPATRESGPGATGVPEGGFATEKLRWRVLWSEALLGEVERWRFTIERLEAGGLAPVFQRDGSGTPPSQVQWDGMSDAKKIAGTGIYIARITLINHRGIEAASPRHPFALGMSPSDSTAIRQVIETPTFTGERGETRPSPHLEAEIISFVRRLAPSGDIRIEVHGDGQGDRLKSVAQTQFEAKSIAALLVSQGIDAARITARGRGAAEPLDESGSPEAMTKNRRVVLSGPGRASSKVDIPLRVEGDAAVRVGGRDIPIAKDDSFDLTVPKPESGEILVDVIARSGRRVAYLVPVSVEGPELLRRDDAASRKVVVSGDLAAKKLQLDFDVAPPELWELHAKLAAVGGLPIPELSTERQGQARRLSSPMDFVLNVNDKLSVERWSLVVAEESGKVVYRHGSEEAVPAVHRWDGLVGDEIVLAQDQRYRYWLEVETADSSSIRSVPGWFHLDPASGAKMLDKEGRFFGRTGSLRAPIKNALSGFVGRYRRSKDKEQLAITLEVVGDPKRVERVRAKVEAYLGQLGLASASYRIQTRDVTGLKDRVAIVADRRPPLQSPSVHINDRVVPLEGSQFEAQVEVAYNEPLVVELLTEEGASLRYTRAPTSKSTTERAGGELISPDASTEVRKPERIGVARDPMDTPAANLRVHLPTKGTVLGQRLLAIEGQAPRRSQVYINGERLSIDERGHFQTVRELPIGESELEIVALDAEGGEAVIHWPVEVATKHAVSVAMVEGIVSTAAQDSSPGQSGGLSAEGAEIAGMDAGTTTQMGPFLLHGRARAYVKARVPGGAISDTVDITAQVDTGRVPEDNFFFQQEQSTNRDHITLGDQATEVRDVNSKGALYARVEAGDSSAVLGSLNTQLEGGGDLFEYERTADGVLADLQRDIGGNKVSVKAFATRERSSSARDTNWFRATGGSLYYLKHGDVIEGSERIEVQVRDRDNGMLLSESELREGIDYSIDYVGGRVRLETPLSTLARSTWVLDNMDVSATPMTGPLVYLRVRYEHEDYDGLSQRSAGLYASTDIEQLVSVGAGAVSEEREGGSDYQLYGADVSVNLGKYSHLSAEIAASADRDAGSFMSFDGGLTFGDLQRDQSFDRVGEDMRVGWKLSADIALRDWTEAREFQSSSMSVYLQDVESGFSSGDSIFDQGRLKFGGRLRHRLSDKDMILFRHEGQVAALPRVGPTAADVGANPLPDELDERAMYLSSVQWARDDGPWHYKVEAMHQRITSEAVLEDGSASIDVRRVGLGALTAYDYSERLSFRGGQQIVANAGDADPILSSISPMNSALRSSDPMGSLVSNVGTDLTLAPELTLSADLFQRWNGDNAARVGLRSALSGTGSMYIQEQVGGVDGQLSSSTIIGAEDRFGSDGRGRTYGEYQIGNGLLGQRDRALLGVGRQWRATSSLGLGVGFEHQQAFGGALPDGTLIGDAQRDLVHGSVTYRPSTRFRLQGQLELRFDQGDEGDGVDESVLGEDIREAIGNAVFADHGGVAPGAALVLPPGDRLQWIAGMAGSFQLDDAMTLLARGRFSQSRHQGTASIPEHLEARFYELSTGLAYRDPRDERYELLSRYSLLYEQGPRSRSDGALDTRSHVLSIMPLVRLPHRIDLAGKLAFKRTLAEDLWNDELRSESRVLALLTLLRLGYRFYGNWDVSAELRQLLLRGDSDDETKRGALFELGYTLRGQLRIGGGYNLSHFSDNELGDLERDTHGFFVRMTGHF